MRSATPISGLVYSAMPLYRLLAIGFAAVSAFGDSPAWIETSNRNAQLLIEVNARFFPESAARNGVPGLDDRILDLKPQFAERRAQALRDAGKILETRLAAEKNPLVRQDLDILIHAEREDVREFELQSKIGRAH